MPIIISPQYNNPQIGQIAANLGTALFGETDPLKVAQASYYGAERQKALADAGLLTAKTTRAQNANQYMTGMAATMHDMRPADPGEDEGAARLRQDTARAHFNMAYGGDNPQEAQQAATGNLASIFMQAPDAGSKRTGSLMIGHPVNVNEAVTPGEVTASQDAAFKGEKYKADTSASASRYGSDQQRIASEYGANQTYAAAMARTNAEHPSNVFEIKPNTEYVPLPGSNPALGRFVGPDGKIHGQRSGGEDALKSLSPTEAAALERATLQQYPGLTTADKKGNTIISSTFANSGLPPDAIARARAAGESAYKRSGNPKDYADAYAGELGKPLGTSFTANENPWGPDFLNPPRGEWGGTPAAPAKLPVTAQAVTAPSAPAGTPAPAAGAVRYTPEQVAAVAKQHGLAEDQVYVDPNDGSIRRKSDPHVLPPASSAAPPVTAQVFAPNPTEQVTSTAVRSAPPPQTAQAFVPPVNLVQPTAPDASTPEFNTLSPALAATGFASPTAVMVARQSADPAVKARVATYDAMQNAGQRGPQSPMVKAPVYSDWKTAYRDANSPNTTQDMKIAARAYLMRHPGGH